MNKLLLVFLTFSVPEIFGLYLRDGKDPFLTGLNCKTGRMGRSRGAKRRLVEDPKFCDRVLLCGDQETAIVQYCPPGQVFVPGRGCVPVLAGRTHCQRRGAKSESPNKVSHKCQPHFVQGNRTDVYVSQQSYFEKIDETKFAACQKRKGLGKIFECYDPNFPELFMEGPDLFKCKPAGFAEATKVTKDFLAKESHFTPKKEVFAAKGLPIEFRDEVPVCPTSSVMRRRFSFDHTTRFPDNSDCLTFWTCPRQNEPQKNSCPKAFKQVFHPRLQKCVHYQDSGVDEACSTFYDQDSELDKSYVKSDLTQGQYLAEMTHLLKVVHDLRLQNIEQYLFVKEELKNFYIAHSSKFQTADGIIEALKNLGIVKDDSESPRETRSTSENDGIPALVWENGVVPKCPQPPFLYDEFGNTAEIKRKIQDGLLNPEVVYKTDFFLFGTFNLMADPEDCGKYYRCDAADAYNENFTPKLIECFNNFVFQPIQMQWQGLIKANTGRCVNPSEIKVLGCENWKSKGNPLTTLVDKTESAQYRPIWTGFDYPTTNSEDLGRILAYDDYEQEELEPEPIEEGDPLKTLETIIDETSKVVQQQTTTSAPTTVTESTTTTTEETLAKEDLTLTQILKEIKKETAREREQKQKNTKFEHFYTDSSRFPFL